MIINIIRSFFFGKECRHKNELISDEFYEEKGLIGIDGTNVVHVKLFKCKKCGARSHKYYNYD